MTAVTFRLSTPLRPYSGGKDRVDLNGSFGSLGEALEALWALHPGLRDRLVTEQGEVRPHVNLFVGTESVRYTGGLQTPLPERCEISILPAVSGGMPARVARRWRGRLPG